MLSWEEFVELRNLHERGWSISAIAHHLGKDRKTVRRYLADPDARPGVRKPAGRLLDPYAAYVQARLEDNPHLAGTVLDRELGELGFAGSYRTLARHVAGVRPDCAACHGPEGNKPTDPTQPILAGQYYDYLVRALKDYKLGRRNNPIMKGFAAQLSAQDIEDLAAWFASQKSNLHDQR